MAKLNKDTFTVEHIDPRNHSLVCGLKGMENEIICDHSWNSAKQNRFVPYRVCEFSAPINSGDLGEFFINGEWIVCEFAVKDGLWWAEANKIGCGSSTKGGRKAEASRKNLSGGGEKRVQMAIARGENPAQSLLDGQQKWRDRDSEGYIRQKVERGTHMMKLRYYDPDHPELGIRAPGPLVRMQKARGYPHGPENRVKVLQQNE